MEGKFQSVDWSEELRTLVSMASTSEEQKAAAAFAQALEPYLEDPAMLRTLLGKIMMSPADTVSIVAAKRSFASLAEIQAEVGDDISVIPL